MSLNDNQQVQTSNQVCCSEVDRHPGYFSYTLDAPTSGFSRKGEVPITYLNKDQFYTLKLQRFPASSTNQSANEFMQQQFMSFITLESIEKDGTFNGFHSLDSDPNHFHHPQILMILSYGAENHLQRAISVSNLAYKVYWSSANSPAKFKMSIRCLSSDFTSQKGVKGMPFYIRIDTYENEQLADRAYAKIKTFCDKGADRKFKDEEKRLSANPLPYPCQDIRPQTVFAHQSISLEGGRAFDRGSKSNVPITKMAQESTHNVSKRRKNNFILSPPPMFVFVRQETEEVFMPIPLKQSTVEGFMNGIASKFEINSKDIRHIYKRTVRGALIHVDTDFVKSLVGGFYLMKVLAVEGSLSHHTPVLDILLCEYMI